MKSILFTLFFLPALALGQAVTFSEAFPALTFTVPIEMVSPPSLDNRIFIVQQNGVIKVFPNRPDVTPADVKVFLDLSASVVYSGELGLLGMAFHPNFGTNGYFYVHYDRSGPNTSVISRFTVKVTNPNEADPASELILLTQEQPYTNHNGGKIDFGTDGYLYISLGDGGSGGDPENRAQDLSTLLGKILRINVNQTSGPLNYSIPNDNPFKDTPNARQEIYAYGLRNAWKFSFDRTTSQLWAADVGQNLYEEIDIVPKGGNMGWRLMEGNHCYIPSSSCNPGTLVLPIFEYPHTSNNNSITGGYVYRGIQLPQWYGKYIYADFISGRVWVLTYENGVANNALYVETGTNVSSFGEDSRKELYLVQYNGKIMRFLPVSPLAPSNVTVTKFLGLLTYSVNWTDNSNNESGFVIQRSKKFGTQNFVSLDTTTANVTEYSDPIGTDTVTYTYRVKSINDGGSSIFVIPGQVVVGLEKTTASSVNVFPNPAKEKVFIKKESDGSVLRNIRMMSIQGLELEVSINYNTDGAEINLQGLSAGLYLLRFEMDNLKCVRKVMVER